MTLDVHGHPHFTGEEERSHTGRKACNWDSNPGRLALMPVCTLPRGQKPHVMGFVASDVAVDIGCASVGLDRRKNYLFYTPP